MSNDVQFRLNRKLQIFFYVILGAVTSAALLVALDPSKSIEQNKALTEFWAGVGAAAIGVLLFFIHRRYPNLKNFVESMPILTLFMAVAVLTIPLFLSYHVSVYYFLPVFLIGLNGWLFFTQHVIYGKNNWHTNPTKKYALVPWYILMGGFFVGTITFVVVASSIPNLI